MMQNEDGQPPVGAAWGKAEDEPVPHPLVCHAIDTAAVARLLYGVLLGPRVRAELEKGFAPLGDAVSWVVLLCGLHDLGKYSPAFQSLRADLVEARLGSDAAADVRWVTNPKGVPRTDTRHGLITAVHLNHLLQVWGARREVADSLARALGGHHGRFPDGASLIQAADRPGDHGAGKWAAWRTSFVGELVRVLGLPEPASRPWREVRIGQAAAVGLAALTSVSDWIASDKQNFPYAGQVTDLAAYAAKAGAQANDAVRVKLDWSRWQPPEDTSFARLFPEDPYVRPVQTVVEQLSVGRTGPVLMVVEAPTGEGKTKAALQAVATLVRDLGLAGTYVAMPTRATSDQVYGVLEQLLKGLGDTTAIRLIYSRTGTRPVGVGIDHPEDSDNCARDWFLEKRKRSLLASLGVGTIDQALKAAIQSGHVFVRLAALSNKVVVVDEAHAYDVYTAKLLDRLLRWLGHLGASVILLSATLPARRRQELMAEWHAGMTGGSDSIRPSVQVGDPLDSTEPAPYPRVSWVEPGPFHPQLEPVGVSDLNRDRVIRLVQIPDDEQEVVSWVLEQVRSGGCAAVVHNLEKSRAGGTYRALKARVKKDFAGMPAGDRPKVVLFTGKLSRTKRSAVEGWLRDAFGQGGSRPWAIVVATQVLEQSLDLDFDVMVSDLAPVDSLIQRAGRLHRHDRRKERGTPVLAITGVTDTPRGPTFPKGLGRVYQSIVLLRTWAILRGKTELRSPEDVPSLVDQVYGPADAVECPAGWKRRWREAEARFLQRGEVHGFGASTVYIPAPNPQHTNLVSLTGRPKSTRRTRLGSADHDQRGARS